MLLLLACFLIADEEHHHAAENLGTVHFPVSCNDAAQAEFDRATAMLHSFWYEEAGKTFTHVTELDPACAMGYWGIAMSLYHQLWIPPITPETLKKGSEALAAAKQIGAKTDREKDYVAAIGTFYQDYDKIDLPTRAKGYEKAMEQLYLRYPEDLEAATFYALALNATAPPTDKTYANQKKAVEILNKVLEKEPEHPGVAHYIIHNCDYPPLASMALNSARTYAKIAPSVPHALHMPSHIFTRLGLWDESIQSNIASENAAKDYGAKTHMLGAWDQQLHAMDYLVYAYLQKGDDSEAKRVVDELAAIQKAQPETLAAAYAFAAIPARYAIERGQWAEASQLQVRPADFPWERNGWAEAVTHFARALGAARSGNLEIAKSAISKLDSLHAAALEAKDSYAADQIEIQRRAANAWLAFTQKKEKEAVLLMQGAADLEKSTEKHAVTPGPILPAPEMLGDLLLELKQPAQALAAFESSLTNSPNRFHGLYGAARAAKLSGDQNKAKEYYTKLIQLCGAGCQRPEWKEAKAFLAMK